MRKLDKGRRRREGGWESRRTKSEGRRIDLLFEEGSAERRGRRACFRVSKRELGGGRREGER